MAHASIPLLSHYLRRLTARCGDPATDHELLQRFVNRREEAAFAALVERHAAMVLGLCRSILRNHHDAEDIFQAVFLVLARKAGSIRKGDSVGSWLYAVAYRLAHKARVRAHKQYLYERRAARPAEQTPMDDVTWGELRDVLHEEVSRLPEKYRAAVVLCYWQGRTHEQAGQHLGCAKSTIKDRLEKAREMLRTRLARRGLALSAAWLAASLSEGTATAVSLHLVQTTVRGAQLFSLGQMPHGIVTASAITNARQILKGMMMSKFKYGLALVLMLGVLGGGAGLAALHKTQAPENESEASATARVPKHEPEASATEEPLPAGAVARLGTLRFRHNESLNYIGVGVDDTSILSAAGTTVYVWNRVTGKERQHFKHESPVLSFACSRNGKLLASGCQDGTIHLWETTTGQELRHFTAHQGKASGQPGPPGVFVIGFTPDGRQLVSVGTDNTLRLWDTASGERIREFGNFSNLATASLSSDGKTLAGAVKTDVWELRLWEVATGQERQRKPMLGKQILSPAFSPDGKMLALAVGETDWNKPCDIQLWDADASTQIHTLRGHKGWAWCTFAPDGKTLASWSSVDRTARLWDVTRGKEIGPINPDKRLPLTQLLFCPDGKTLASYTQGYHVLHFWDRASGKEVHSSRDAFSPVDFLNFSPDGRVLAAGSKEDVAIRLWEVSSRNEVRRLEHGPLTALQFSLDGSRLASAAWTDAQVRIWETATGKELRRIPSEKGGGLSSIACMAWSKDGKVLATWNLEDRLLRLWDAETGKRSREWNPGLAQVESLVFSPDNRILAAFGCQQPSGNQTMILLWDVDTGRSLPPLEAPLGFAHSAFYAHPRITFSPDGRMLAAGGQGPDARIYLWEMISGRLRLTLKAGEDVTSLAFSPNGKLLAAANNLNASRHIRNQAVQRSESRPPRVHLWDVAAEKELPSLEGHQGSIASLSFSPDGKLLATGSNDTTILLWDATRFQTNRPAEVRLSAEQLESLWADLGGEDAAKAYHAIRTLAAAPKSSVAFLKRHLKPVAPVDAKKIARLIADLDSEQFAVREKAMKQLEKFGDRAATELRKALAGNPPLEVRRRIEQLLERRNGTDHIRMVRALETLENIATAEARDLCAKLAGGVADAPLTREALATLRRMTR